MSLADKIAASKARWERRPQDFYGTPPEVTQALLDYMAFSKKMKIREPCCGEGHMAEVLREAGHTVVSSDLEYRGYGRGGVDYCSLPETDSDYYDMEAVITNPPFSEATAIILRALRDAPIVCILLPSGFWHAAGRAELFKTRRPEIILNLTWRPVFAEERGASPLMNVQWTVWLDDTGFDGPRKRLTYFDLLHRPLDFPAPRKPTAEILIGRTGLLAELEGSFLRRLEK